MLRAPPYNLELDEATARALLGPPSIVGAGASEQPEAPSRWQELVLHGPWPLVLDLMREQPLLRQAALSTTLVVEAMFTPLTSTIALQLVQMPRLDVDLAAERFGLRRMRDKLSMLIFSLVVVLLHLMAVGTRLSSPTTRVAR